MKPELRFEGLREAEARLQKEIRRVGMENNRKFVTLALKSVEAATSPYVPVDKSTLINSAFSRLRPYKGSTGLTGVLGEFGYGAEYAGYVHEGGPKNWQKAGASDAFLAKGVDDFINETLDELLSVLGE
jgi:hypothetical protein